MPAVVLILVLTAAAGAVWASVLARTDPEALGCPAPPPIVGAVPAGETLPATALDGVAPAPPQLVRVQVLNGNGQRGEAGIVTAGLTELGFVPAAEPANDPLHPTFELTCHGQIRFGAAGMAAARTLSLVVPCAELVRDARPDDVVDLALGTEFAALAPSPAVQSVLGGLRQLGQPAPAPTDLPQGGQAAGPVQPTIDPQQITAARTADCGPAQ